MVPDQDSTGHPRLAVASAALPPIGLVGGWTIAAAVQPGGFDSIGESISALAASATPHRWIMTTGLLLTGLGHVVTSYAVPRLAIRARAVLALGGLCVLLVAAVPLPSRTDGSGWHTAIATVGFVALSVWPLLSARPDGPWPQRPLMARSAGGVLLALTVLLGAATVWEWAWFGLVERLAAGLQALWPLVVAGGTWWAAGHRIGSRRVRRALAVVGLVVAAGLGGAATTVLLPTTVQTDHYEATVSLSLNPRSVNTLRAQTVFGDVSVRFGGVAPGVVVRPQVKANITDVLGTSDASLASLQPTQDELDDAARAAAVDIAIRFLVGGLVTALAVTGIAAAVTGARAGRSATAQAAAAKTWRVTRLVAPASAAVAATAITLGATAQTYRPARQVSFATTGLINVVQQNAALFDDLAARSKEVTPYLRNLLALSAALREKYAPGVTQTSSAVRFLLVSDIHDGNLYPLMRTIVQQERIDAVVDAGDLATFGRPGELDAAGIPAGIASLGVPYLFVKGNHDAISADDRAVLDRLARIRNVVLLQPSTDLYREATVGGVRVAGFNDPRWFGDSGTHTAEAQKPATAAFLATFGNRLGPDLVVGHEPSAVRGLKVGAILVNGHMHVPDLEGHRIQVGTFTGGGPFSHFLENDSGEELVAQPNAFDVLDFGADCRLGTLTRYTFRNVVEGRPVYDDVSLVNGATVAGKAAAPAQGETTRACDRSTGVEVEDVPAVPVATGGTTTTTGTATPGTTTLTPGTPSGTTTTP